MECYHNFDKNFCLTAPCPPTLDVVILTVWYCR